MEVNKSKYLLFIALYLILLAIIFFYPFKFDYPYISENNNVAWLKDQNGIEFSSTGIIHSISPLEKFFDALVSGKGFTIELWLSINNRNQTGPARIFSYSLDSSRRNFTIGQQEKDLVVRIRTEKTDLNGLPGWRIKNILVNDEPIHIVVMYDYNHVSIYINGYKFSENFHLNGMLSNWDSSCFLLIGNEKTGNRPWNGKLFLIAIYNRTLSWKEIFKNYKVGKVVNGIDIITAKRVNKGLNNLYLFNKGGGNIIRDYSGSLSSSDLYIPKKVFISKSGIYEPFYDIKFNLDSNLF
jgi:hypothetical protein